MVRIVIRKPLHGFLEEKASALGVEDLGEVVNYLLLQLMDKNLQCLKMPVADALQPQVMHVSSSDDGEYSDLSGLIDL
ncbi:hypothetical protein NIES4106_61270 (plasmid) [Fischerella sp. NIES-4106]|nr:hypothetical protein NIES4106_61270 [Fischerella sp. NIES-4106]